MSSSAPPQTADVMTATLGHGWLTLAEIAERTGHPEPSISARLRDLRKRGLIVDRQRRKDGLYEYRVRKVVRFCDRDADPTAAACVVCGDALRIDRLPHQWFRLCPACFRWMRRELP